MPDDRQSGELLHREDQEQIDREAAERERAAAEERERSEAEERERSDAEKKGAKDGKAKDVYRPKQLVHAAAEAQATSARAVRGTIEQKLEPIVPAPEVPAVVEAEPAVAAPTRQPGKVEDPWQGGRSPAERFGGGNQRQTPGLGGAPSGGGDAPAGAGESWSAPDAPPTSPVDHPAPVAFDWLKR